MVVPLQLEQVGKFFGEKKVVHRLSFQVDEGEIYGLLGSNGAGKTTTIRMIVQLLRADEGKIRYFGSRFREKCVSLFGYLPEERRLYPKIKVCDQMIYLAQLQGMSREKADQSLATWLDKFEISEYKKAKVEELSKGNQQRVQFIASIIHDPKIIILDEAFSDLDTMNVEIFKKNVKELRNQGKSIVFSTQRMEYVEELCQNITLIKKAKTILQGPIREIKKKFPQDRVIVGKEGKITGLHTIAGVSQVRLRSDGKYEVFINEPTVGQHVLNHVLKQGPICHYELVNPTLHDIFIQMEGASYG